MQSFEATVQKAGSKVFILLPFDPNHVWGDKQRHYVHGLVNEARLRSLLKEDEEGFVITLGAAFRRDSGIAPGETVTVSIEPEGPQLSNMAADIVAALEREPQAVAFFNSLATHYRKNYVNWVEEAKRDETRAKRIVEMITLLNQGKQKK